MSLILGVACGQEDAHAARQHVDGRFSIEDLLCPLSEVRLLSKDAKNDKSLAPLPDSSARPRSGRPFLV